MFGRPFAVIPKVGVTDDGDKAGAAFSQSLRAFVEQRSGAGVGGGAGLTCPVTFLGPSPSGSAGASASGHGGQKGLCCNYALFLYFHAMPRL